MIGELSLQILLNTFKSITKYLLNGWHLTHEETLLRIQIWGFSAFMNEWKTNETQHFDFDMKPEHS